MIGDPPSELGILHVNSTWDLDTSVIWTPLGADGLATRQKIDVTRTHRYLIDWISLCYTESWVRDWLSRFVEFGLIIVSLLNGSLQANGSDDSLGWLSPFLLTAITRYSYVVPSIRSPMYSVGRRSSLLVILIHRPLLLVALSTT